MSTKKKPPELKKINYPETRKPKVTLDGRIDHNLTQEFKQYTGKPNASRYKRAVVKAYNPLHYVFGIRLKREINYA